MHVTLHDDPAPFLVSADDFLAADPFQRNVIATVATVARDRAAWPGAVWCTVEDGSGHVVGAAMHTPPYGAAVSDMPGDAARAVADGMHRAGRQVGGATGARPAVDAFADRWAEVRGVRAREAHAMGVFALGDLVDPPPVPGRLRRPTAEENDLLHEWGRAFHAEAGLPSTEREASVEQMLTRPGLRVWDDNGPVAFLAHTATTAGVARVGPVYTPPEYRRRGYAAAATAGVCRLLLDAGARVMLYTDLANPTSNGVYTRIGFVRIGDAAEIAFDDER